MPGRDGKGPYGKGLGKCADKTQKKQGKNINTAIIDKTVCISCGACFLSCARGAIIMLEKPFIDKEICTACGACLPDCPVSAIYIS